ncbi:E3 ubiquitin-protein ligase MARCH11-like [Coffea eugenioides]|uniref:RING-CH-type domain-containing protein n=1 Tax=Coffea arabica TaxID=13443 RepID=A0ABM4UCL8_COFAR|nr:E3 ubiquitin-protein ligase MARCH11-like [Coffea eugenioides]
MEPPELVDHAQSTQNCFPKSSVNIGVEASTAGVEPRVEDANDDSRMLSTNDSGSPEGTSLGEGREDKRPKEETGSHADDVKIDEEHLRAEQICRICHLGNEPSSSGSSELIQLGCHCRGELGISHRSCAETWFQQRGNRLCEICNNTAKNVRLIKDISIYIRDYHEIRPMAVAGYDSPRESPRRCKQFCNFLLACLVVGFIISTFLRARMF